MSVGHGGQILVSQTTYELARDTQMGDSQFIDMGEHHLKSILRPVVLYQLNTPGLPFQFPALKSLDYSPHNLPELLKAKHSAVRFRCRKAFVFLFALSTPLSSATCSGVPTLSPAIIGDNFNPL